MSAQKTLQADVNYLNERLTHKKNTKIPVMKDMGHNPYTFNEAKRKIVPYDRAALTKQYYLLKELVADYLDKKQVKLFDQAINIFDQANIGRRNDD